MENALRGLVLGLLVALYGCGGGDGDESTPARVSVASSAYNFTPDGPLQDVVFPTATFINRGTDAMTVQVHATSTRALAAPASVSGSLYLFVGVSDAKTGQLVLTDCRLASPAPVAAGTTLHVAEDLQCAVTIPGGQTFAFTPYARVVASAQSASGFVLTTTGYELTVAP
jgi:hypothetical protein